MGKIESDFAEAIIEAERACQSAENTIKIIMPVVNDQKLLVRALETLYNGCSLIASNILKYEYVNKRIELYKESEKNLEIFLKKCADRYGLSEHDKTNIKNLLYLGRKHKESGFEFSRTGKIIILNNDLSMEEINKNKIESFIFSLQKLIKNIRISTQRS